VTRPVGPFVTDRHTWGSGELDVPPHEGFAVDPDVVRRHNELADLYNAWPGDGDPDDDPDFVAAARKIMETPAAKR
jgi:hypothetical protein